MRSFSITAELVTYCTFQGKYQVYNFHAVGKKKFVLFLWTGKPSHALSQDWIPMKSTLGSVSSQPSLTFWDFLLTVKIHVANKPQLPVIIITWSVRGGVASWQ